jgi:hypothetical protein
MKLSTLTNKLKRQSASSILGKGSEETQLAFSFEFERKPANTLSLKAVIKKVLAIGIVGFSFTGVVIDAFKNNLIFIVRGINNQFLMLNNGAAEIEAIKAQGS